MRMPIERGIVCLILLQIVFGNKLKRTAHMIDSSKFEGISFKGCLAHGVKTDSNYWDNIDTVYPDYTCPDSDFRKSISKLMKYRKFLVQGTLDGQDWSHFGSYPLTRFDTLKRAFGDFEQMGGKIVVEVGTSRSFTHGNIPEGCNSNNQSYWHPHRMQDWDWGAGVFTVVASDCLNHINGINLTSVDLQYDHLMRSKLMTQQYDFVSHFQSDSSLYFQNYQGKIDLLYMGTADVYPIEPSAELHLREAQVIVERDLISENGIILIDDVLNQTPYKLGDRSLLGKSKYSIPYLLSHGFSLEMAGYQVVLKKMPTFSIQPKPLSLAPPRVLHVGFHAGTQLELAYIAKELGFDLEFQFVEDPVPNVKDNNLKYNINFARAERIWKANVKYYSTFDLIIVSDTSAISRIAKSLAREIDCVDLQSF